MQDIAFIGGGNMARSLVGGLIKSGTPPTAIRVADPVLEPLAPLGVRATRDNAEAARGAAVVVLAIKPQVMETACRAISAELAASAAAGDAPLVVSVAAGTRIADIERWLGQAHAVVRCMPNTPALLGAGATGMCANPRASAVQRANAERLLANVGAVEWIADEALMDAVTALSGSGPAYVFMLIEHMTQAAVGLGLPAASARRLAVQTVLGAARMAAESGVDPAELRRRVTSPGGTTAAALASFERDAIATIIARALTAARDRGVELGEGR
jgi:pyrroline-5-carboxylate reductase